MFSLALVLLCATAVTDATAPVTAAVVKPPPIKRAMRTQLFTAPTGEVLDEGLSRLSLTELGAVQFNYGAFDNVQIGLNTLAVVFMSADVKVRLFEEGNASGAVVAGFVFSPVDRTRQGGYGRFAVTDHFGRTSVTGGLNFFGIGDAHGSEQYVWGTLGVAREIGPVTTLLAEVNVGDAFGTDAAPFGDQDADLVSIVGARFSWQKFAVTPGYVTFYKREAFRDGMVGIPYLDFAYAF